MARQTRLGLALEPYHALFRITPSVDLLGGLATEQVLLRSKGRLRC